MNRLLFIAITLFGVVFPSMAQDAEAIFASASLFAHSEQLTTKFQMTIQSTLLRN